MLYISSLKYVNEDKSAFYFLYDEETNTTCKDLIQSQELADKIFSNRVTKLGLERNDFKFGSVVVNVIAPVLIETGELTQEEAATYDMNQEFEAIIQQPFSAREPILQRLPEQKAFICRKLLESYDFIISLKTSSLIALDEQYFADKELYAEISKNAPLYKMNPLINQNVFQTDPEANYCITLPDASSLYYFQEENFVKPSTIMQVIAPYRQYGLYSDACTGYKAEYHTPFFRAKFLNNSSLERNSVSSDFRWLFGENKNNLLKIQKNEEQMYANLEQLYKSDLSSNLEQIMAALFNTIPFIRKIKQLSGMEIDAAIVEYNALLPDMPTFITSKLSEEDFRTMSNKFNNQEEDTEAVYKITNSDLKSILDRKFTIGQEGIEFLINAMLSGTRELNCKGFNITPVFDETINRRTVFNLLLTNNFITNYLSDYFVDFAVAAASVNWGHTGSMPAITELSSLTTYNDFNNDFITYINGQLSKTGNSSSSVFDKYNSFSTDSSESDDDSEDDDFNVPCPYYLSGTTINMVRNSATGDISVSVLQSQRSINSMSPQDQVIERWRVIKGDATLSNFIHACFNQTKDVRIYFLAIIKLLRWGDSRKPSLIAFPEYPELRYIFDLNETKVIDNNLIADESNLKLIDGCHYSLETLLYSKSKILSIDKPIVGFVLVKDYGNVKTREIASWSDMYELTSKDPIDIYPLNILHKSVSDIVSSQISIEDFAVEEAFELFSSDKNIKEAHKLNCLSTDLSECSMLTIPNITRDRAYQLTISKDTYRLISEKKCHITKNYIMNIGKLYSNYKEDISSMSNVSDILNLIKAWGGNSKETNVTSQNSVTAASTLSKMNLSSKADNITGPEYTKFGVPDYENVRDKCVYGFVVNDHVVECNYSPITFNTPSLVELYSRCKGEIVLTVAIYKEKNISYIMTRNDIPDDKIALTDTGKKVLYKYSQIDKVLKTIKKSKILKTGKGAIFVADKSLEGRF